MGAPSAGSTGPAGQGDAAVAPLAVSAPSGVASPLWARVLLLVVPALWSTNYLIARLADGVIGPHALAAGRWLLAFLLMLPFVWRPLRQAAGAWRREWPHLLVLGFLGMYVCGAWVYQAGHSTSSTNIALIYAITPVSIAVASARLLHEPLRPAQRWALALALAGTVFVITRGDWRVLSGFQLAAGDLWIMAAAASWTAYSVLLRYWPSQLSPAVRLVAIIAGGLVWLLPGAALESWLTPQPVPGPSAWGLVVLTALVPGVLSYGAYSLLQRELGAARTALMLYLAPLYGAIGAWWVLGERPGWHHLVGAALILPSIALATRRQGR
jgi:drug/metabolite transporter (DMT)-like permease